MNKNELIKSVEQWFYDRGLHEADPEKQYLKLIEEVGELASGIARGNEELTKDSIGDIAVVIIGLCTQTGIDGTDVFDIYQMNQNYLSFKTYILVKLIGEMESMFYKIRYVGHSKLHDPIAVDYARGKLLDEMIDWISRLSSISRYRTKTTEQT